MLLHETTILVLACYFFIASGSSAALEEPLSKPFLDSISRELGQYLSHETHLILALDSDDAFYQFEIATATAVSSYFNCGGLDKLEQSSNSANQEPMGLTVIMPNVPQPTSRSISLQSSARILAPASWKAYLTRNIRLRFDSDVYLYNSSNNSAELKITEIYSIKGRVMEQEVGLWGKEEAKLVFPVKAKWDRRRDLKGLSLKCGAEPSPRRVEFNATGPEKDYLHC